MIADTVDSGLEGLILGRGRGYKNCPMALFTKAGGRTTKLMARVGSLTRREMCTKVSGLMI